MRHNHFILCFFIVLFMAACGGNQTVDPSVTTSESTEVAELSEGSIFDSIRATKLGADDYGMKTYIMAFLKIGPNRPKETALSDSLQAAHMANISKLADEGKLVLAGPFYGNDSLRGIYIFDTDSLELAEQWTATDPAIIYGSLKMELKKWYGSAALMEVKSIHYQIAKIKF